MLSTAVIYGVFVQPAFGLDLEVARLPVREQSDSGCCIFSWHHYFALYVCIINFQNFPIHIFPYLNSHINVLLFQKLFQVRNADFFIMKQARSQRRVSACIKHIGKMLHSSGATAGDYRNR